MNVERKWEMWVGAKSPSEKRLSKGLGLKLVGPNIKIRTIYRCYLGRIGLNGGGCFYDKNAVAKGSRVRSQIGTSGFQSNFKPIIISSCRRRSWTMGKKQHSKDRMFITKTEWATEWGGAKSKENRTPFKSLPFYCCAYVNSFIWITVCEFHPYQVWIQSQAYVSAVRGSCVYNRRQRFRANVSSFLLFFNIRPYLDSQFGWELQNDSALH